MNPHRLTRTAALGLTVAALAAPTAAAQQDLRSADARDAARTSSLAGTTSTPRQDVRSPDTRDYAEGRGTFNAPEVTVVKLAQPAPAGDGGIDWGDAGIGAGSMLGLALLALGGTFAVVHRRQGARPMATTG
jgi:hypothetical protein